MAEDARRDADTSDDDDEAQLALAAGGQVQREHRERIALFDFLRLVANNRDRAAFATNVELVNHLKENGTISSEDVARAMFAVPRNLFVPPPHQAEALVDRPVRITASGFNISAPHVQAAALEALRLEAGQRVLDVGCGCGIVAAYAAHLVGPSGEVVGVDIRPAAISLATSNLRRLHDTDPEFSEVAAPIRLEVHNVFVPLLRHRGRYDIVYVGGATPESHVGALLDLLAPGGGRIVVPVSGLSELRLITKYADGRVQQRTLSQVSFSELEVPRDVEVVVALELERAERARRVEVPASTYAADLAALAAPGADLAAAAAEAAAEAAAAAAAEGGAPAPAGGSSAPCAAVSAVANAVAAVTVAPRGGNGHVRPRSETSVAAAHQSSATPAPARRGAPSDSSSGGSSGSSGSGSSGSSGSSGGNGASSSSSSSMSIGGGGGGGATSGGGGGADSSMLVDVQHRAAPAGATEDGARAAEAEADADADADAAHAPAAAPPPSLSYLSAPRGALALGPPDCRLQGPGWILPAHKAVLQARCDLLRAHAGSGMRDCDADCYAVPEAVVSAEAMGAFLHYAYTDSLPPGGLDSGVMLQLLHAATYFGAHRLVRVCEAVLARELMAAAGGGGGGDGGGGGGDPEALAAAVASAAPLLALADEMGLEQLGTVAMQFLLDHFAEASASEGYRSLPRPLVDRVAAEAVRRHAGLLEELRGLAGLYDRQAAAAGPSV